MVRAVAVVLVAVLGGCSGRSTRDEGTGTGGSATGGSGATTGGSNEGGSSTGGSSAGGSAGSGAGGECAEPNPAGCQYQACPSGQSCVLTSGRCIPSSCSCEGGEWACTRDCGGGVCGEGPACTAEKPLGCLRDSECAPGERCIPLLVDVCLEGGGCVCDAFNDQWICPGGCVTSVCGVP